MSAHGYNKLLKFPHAGEYMYLAGDFSDATALVLARVQLFELSTFVQVDRVILHFYTFPFLRAITFHPMLNLFFSNAVHDILLRRKNSKIGNFVSTLL